MQRYIRGSIANGKLKLEVRVNRQLDRVARALNAVPEWLVTHMPGPQGTALRHAYWNARMAHVGVGVTFGVGVRIINPQFMHIGDNTWIDDYVILIAGPPGDTPNLHRKDNEYYRGREGELHIGRNCHIAPQTTLQAHGGIWIGNDTGVASGCRIYSLSHHYRGRRPGDESIVFKFTPCAPADEQSLISAPVVLEDNSAVGLNSVVLPGATIRTGSWVGVLSTVAAEIPPNVVAAGNPAKPIREIRRGPTGSPEHGPA